MQSRDLVREFRSLDATSKLRAVLRLCFELTVVARCGGADDLREVDARLRWALEVNELQHRIAAAAVEVLEGKPTDFAESAFAAVAEAKAEDAVLCRALRSAASRAL